MATSLDEFTKRLDALEKSKNERAMALRMEYRSKMEPLLQRRHAALVDVPNFWSGILSSPHTPLASLANGTIDPKVMRSVVDFKVESASTEDGRMVRTVSATLRRNMFCEEGEVSRTVDSNGTTQGVAPIRWKSGTERARQDSVFTFFEEPCQRGDGFIYEALEAFDMIYQNPFLAAEAD